MRKNHHVGDDISDVMVNAAIIISYLEPHSQMVSVFKNYCSTILPKWILCQTLQSGKFLVWKPINLVKFINLALIFCEKVFGSG